MKNGKHEITVVQGVRVCKHCRVRTTLLAATGETTSVCPVRRFVVLARQYDTQKAAR